MNTETYSVPYKFYRLTKLRVWRSTSVIVGFETIWTVPDSYTGYAPITRMFGGQVPVIDFYDVLNIEELMRIEVKFDTQQPRNIRFTGTDPTDIKAEIKSKD